MEARRVFIEACARLVADAGRPSRGTHWAVTPGRVVECSTVFAHGRLAVHRSYGEYALTDRRSGLQAYAVHGLADARRICLAVGKRRARTEQP